MLQIYTKTTLKFLKLWKIYHGEGTHEIKITQIQHFLFQQCFDEEFYGEGEGEDVKPVFDISDEEMGKYSYTSSFLLYIYICPFLCVELIPPGTLDKLFS